MDNKKKLALCVVVSAFITNAFAGSDLIIDDISFLSLPAKGNCTNFSVTVTNIGDQVTNGAGLFSLRSSSLLTQRLGEDREFGFNLIFEPGESQIVSVVGFNFPELGEHIVIGTVDSRNEIEESMQGRNAEQNNQLKKNVNVRYTCPNNGEAVKPIIDTKLIKKLHIDPKEGRPNLDPKVRFPVPRSISQ